MSELDPEKLRSVLTDAFHPLNYSREVAGEVLGTPVSQHRTIEKSIPAWRWPLWGTAFEDMTKEGVSQFRRTRVFGGQWHREGAPGYSMVQVGLNKERSVLSEGHAVIETPKAKFVLEIFPVPRSIIIRAVANDCDKEIVSDFFKEMNAWITANNFFRKQKVDAAGRFLNLAELDERDLILPEDIKRELFRNVSAMVEKAEVYARFGIPSKRGIILAGPPGNGKSMSLKVLAKTLDCSFILATPRQVMEADGFSQIYEFAREIAPSVVLLEDADVFGLDRRLGTFSPLLGELLNITDGVVENKGVITVLTSNYAEILDSALTNRPGRFDTRIVVGPPGPKEAFEIIRRTLEKRKVVYVGDPNTLKSFAQSLADSRASGAYVVEVVNYASMLAVERGRGTAQHLRLDAKDMKDSVDRVVATLLMNSQTEKSLAGENLYKWGAWYAGGGSNGGRTES